MHDWKAFVRRRLIEANLNSEPEEDVLEELAQHLEDVYRQKITEGQSDGDAYRLAIADLNDAELLRELTALKTPHSQREESRTAAAGLHEHIGRDIRYAFRNLRKNPLFSLMAIFTLAIGIGANSAIYSVIFHVLIKPLPLKEPQRLVVMQTFSAQEHSEGPSGGAPADFWDWQSQSKSFQQLAMLRGDSVSLKDLNQPELLPGARVTTNFFATLGAQPLLGRTFVAQEGSLKAPNTAVLSYELWQHRFAGDKAITGKSVLFDGVPTTIIGVMPRDFRFPPTARLWVPLARDSGEMSNRANSYFFVVGRLTPGTTLQRAETEMRTIAKRLEMQYPDTNKGRTIHLTPFQELLVQNIRPALYVLLASACFVLLIACANVSNLLLARATSREKELAIRAALGAARKSLVAQLFIESLLLAVAGGLVAILISMWSLNGISAIAAHLHAFQLLGKLQLDWQILLFTLCASIFTSLLFGIFPALKATGRANFEPLKDSRGGINSVRTQSSARTLVAAQIAIALILLTGAGLFLQSFIRLQHVRLGYDPHDLLTMTLAGVFPKYEDDAARARFFKAVLEKVNMTPGVQSAAITSSVPFGLLGFSLKVQGDVTQRESTVRYSAVSANYFDVAKIPLLAGRKFTNRDTINFPPVAIVNRTLVRQAFAGANPLHKRVSINYLGKWKEFEIVGIVGDSKQEELASPARPEMFVSSEQNPWLSGTLVIRSRALTEGALKASVQRAIWSIDPDLPVSEAKTMEEILSQMTTEPRLYSLLLSIFALVALSLAAIGIYGVVATSVSQRTHEFGIRMALGAAQKDLLALVVGQGMKLAAFGIGCGLIAAAALTGFLKHLLYGVHPLDAMTFGSVAFLLAAVAILASYVPAKRASKTDPMIALRYE